MICCLKVFLLISKVVFDYNKAGSLDCIYKSLGKPFSEEQIILICFQVLKVVFYLKSFPFCHSSLQFFEPYIIIQALEYLNTVHGVAHRDIKGANILISRSGTVQLCDFGCIGHLSPKITYEAECKTFTGTLYWMSPEVMISNPLREPANIFQIIEIATRSRQLPYDCKVDVWSLGITAIECAESGPPRASQVLIIAF